MSRVTVFQGGRILTGDPSKPQSDTIAVADGRIISVADASVRADDVVDLAGGTLIPGFRDGHIHALWGGTESLDAPVTDAADLDDLIDRVRRFADANPHLDWVVGHGYPCELLPGGVGQAAWLDAVVGDRPVALWASDHHTMWVNSRALALADIDAATPDPPAGQIVRDADGHPAGTLLESAMGLVAAHVPAHGRAEKARGLRIALAQMAAAGIVWGQEAALSPDDVDIYLDAAAAGELTADINIALRVDAERWRQQRGEFIDARARADKADPPPLGRVTVRTVKVFADGVIESGTGALVDPYADDLSSRGILNYSGDELAAAVAAFDEDGFQAHIHAIGDAGIRMALDAVERTASRNGRRDRRAVIAHTQLVHPDDLERFAELGVVANFEPLWACRSPVMTELTEPRLGEQRSAWQYPIATLLRGGAPVSFGSDWPVSSMIPMEGLSVAVTRRTPQGDPPEGWLPHERLTLGEALSAYTRGSAYQGFDEDTGIIAEGALADLCLLGAPVETIPLEELADVPVTGTWLHGTEVHRS
ncbi:MAG TPA: amidohydrolase [Egibacteraceae bacterium]|nr:amidohydrolase [Egibacteraceae bacterium]